MTSCLDKTEQSNLGKTIFGPGGVNRDTKNKSRQLTCILLLAHYLSFWISSAPYQVSYSPFSLPLGKSAEWRALKYCTVISNISAFSSFPEFFMGEENDTITCIYCNQNLIWRHHAMKKKKEIDTCLANAIGTVFPSSLRQRLIRSRLRFSMTLWEMGVLWKHGQKSRNTFIYLFIFLCESCSYLF